PASSAAVASSRWYGTFTVTATTSTAGLFTSSWWLSNAAGTPKSLLAASADSRRVVDSAVISKSSASDLKAGMCACAAHPRSGLAPMMPTRIRLAAALLIAIKPLLVTGGDLRSSCRAHSEDRLDRGTAAGVGHGSV